MSQVPMSPPPVAPSGPGRTPLGAGAWVAIAISGVVGLVYTGVLATLTAPLKDAEVPIFALSTWSAQFSVTRLTADARNTDYVLIPWEKTDIALAALEQQGWKVVRSNTA